MSAGSPSHRRGSSSIVVALVAAAIVASCGVAPPKPSPTATSTAANRVESPSRASETPSRAGATRSPVSGTPTRSVEVGVRRDLLLLAGRPGAMGLERIDDTGTRRPVSLPDPDVAWLSTSRDGRALVTTRDGRPFVSGPLTEGSPVAWRPVSTGGLDLRRLAGPLAFGSLAPTGSRAAFIAADFASGGPFDLVSLPIPDAAGPDATDPLRSTDLPAVIRIDRAPEGAPPNWIGPRLVVLARTSTDAVGSIIVDAAGGLTDGPPAPRSSPVQPGALAPIRSIAGLSIAADGERLAVMSEPEGRIDIRPVAGWLTGDSSPTATVELEPEPDGSRSVAWLAMAPDGQRLAVVRTTDDGASVAVTIHDGAEGWRQSHRIALPAGAERAVVAWLP